MSTFWERLGAHNGSLLIADTNARTSKTLYGFIAQEDTVVSVCTGTDEDGAAVDFVAVQGLGSKTLKQGALIVAPANQTITAITLTSGSVIAY